MYSVVTQSSSTLRQSKPPTPSCVSQSLQLPTPPKRPPRTSPLNHQCPTTSGRCFQLVYCARCGIRHVIQTFPARVLRAVLYQACNTDDRRQHCWVDFTMQHSHTYVIHVFCQPSTQPHIQAAHSLSLSLSAHEQLVSPQPTAQNHHIHPPPPQPPKQPPNFGATYPRLVLAIVLASAAMLLQRRSVLLAAPAVSAMNINISRGTKTHIAFFGTQVAAPNPCLPRSVAKRTTR